MKTIPLDKLARTEATNVEVQNPEQIKNARHVAEIRKLGSQIIVATVATGEIYFRLCEYIRNNSVAPKMVSFELKELGFHKMVVSEINRATVNDCTPDTNCTE